jgi:hypothetical protein
MRAASATAPLSSDLFSGGDARLALDPVTGASRYGCRPEPDAALAAFGSSTASTLSGPAQEAAARLWERFALAPEALRPRLARFETQRLRFELIHLLGLGDLPGLDVVFAASGTDVHLIAADLFADRLFGETVAILPDPAETGSGVPAALAGRHFGGATPSGAAVDAGALLEGITPLETLTVSLRDPCGAARAAATIDAEVEDVARALISRGRRVLLTMVDGSKTGLVAPSPACALRLKRWAPGQVDVLVDACQLRLTPANLRAYLDHDFLVAVTGSKFLTGPTFSGALLVPPTLATRLATRGVCAGLADYCAAGEWPADWTAVGALRPDFNLGLLLRWEAALAEFRIFRRLDPSAVAGVFARFDAAIGGKLAAEAAFEPLPAPDLRVRFKTGGWDETPTLFPFVLRHVRNGKARAPFSREQTLEVYAALRQPLTPRADDGLTDAQRALPVELGQPVALGVRDGIPISALRVCMSARLAAEALTGGEDAVIGRATDALAKTAEIARRVSMGN